METNTSHSIGWRVLNTNKNPKTYQKATSVGEDEENLALSYTASGNIKWSNGCGKQNSSPSKNLKHELLYDPEISLLGIYPKELKAGT